MTRFPIYLHSRSTHHIEVWVHGSLQALQRWRRKVTPGARSCLACCWQCHRVAERGLFAELHLPGDRLTLDSIAHECAHAAVWRAKILGAIAGSDDFEEWVAGDTGKLVERVVLELKRRKFRLKVESLKNS